MTPDLPDWLVPIAALSRSIRGEDLSTFLPPENHEGREGAVLILFGEGQSGEAGKPTPDLLLIERAHDMRSHAGQPAFPGGAIEPGETPEEAALREAHEETGLDPAGVVIFGRLPDLWLPPSNFAVTPVLGWWRDSSPVWAADPREVASVERISIAELVDPANRVTVVHPSGYRSAGFLVRGLTVWGFTAGLISRLITLAGWEEPWDATRLVDVETEPAQ
jgi:8-oxo-dGTP pyrophosphatase MutT (NUDIX family)